MTPAEMRTLELKAKRGDPQAAILLGQLLRDKLASGAAGAQIIDPNKADAIPEEHRAPAPCECGNDVFETTTTLRLVKDKREGDKPQKLAVLPLKLLKCLRCGRYIAWVKKSTLGPLLEGQEDELVQQITDISGNLEAFMDKAVRTILGKVSHILDTALGDEKRADEIMNLILTNLGYEVPKAAEAPVENPPHEG